MKGGPTAVYILLTGLLLFVGSRVGAVQYALYQ